MINAFSSGSIKNPELKKCGLTRESGALLKKKSVLREGWEGLDNLPADLQEMVKDARSRGEDIEFQTKQK